MAVLSDKVILTSWTRVSNYAGNSSSNVALVERLIEGTGVNKTPNWRKLPAVQKILPKTYSKSWLVENHGYRTYSHTESPPSGTTLFLTEAGPLGQIFGKNSEIPGVEDEARYKAKSKLFTELKGEGANIANMFGERKQIAASITNVVNTLVYTVRDLKRGNLVSAIRRMAGDPLSAVKDKRTRARIKGASYDANREIQRDKTIHAVARELRPMDIANQWLSLQYGWKPLLGDVYDLVNGLHHRETTFPKTFRCGTKHSLTAKSDSSWALNLDGKNTGIRSTTAAVKYTVHAFPNSVLAEPAALGLTNPLVVAWELTPWSFVVDWFLPVGSYLEQLSADHGWTFHSGCESVLVKSKETAGGSYTEGHSSAGWTYKTTQNFWGVNSYERFGRGVLGGFPSVSAPRFKNPFSAGHVANAIALLAQVFSGANPSHGVPRR